MVGSFLEHFIGRVNQHRIHARPVGVPPELNGADTESARYLDKLALVKASIAVPISGDSFTAQPEATRQDGIVDLQMLHPLFEEEAVAIGWCNHPGTISDGP